LRRLRADRRGSFALEMGLLLPILLTLYFVGYAVSDAIACNRKVTTAARSVADLASRYSSVTVSDVTTIMSASAQIMSPYNTASAGVRLSELLVTDATHATVVWSQVQSGTYQSATALTAGTSVAIPSGVATVGAYLVMGEVTYRYTPLFTYGPAGVTMMYDRTLMSPRLSDQVPLS